jgi:hypothetical protein
VRESIPSIKVIETLKILPEGFDANINLAINPIAVEIEKRRTRKRLPRRIARSFPVLKAIARSFPV